jgi:hypothetical protein
MSYNPVPSPNPYRPYVVPLDPAPSILPSKSSPRDLLADLDISTDYFENPEFSELVWDLVTKGISKYASTFIRQPFEIVKTILQVQYLGTMEQRKLPPPPLPKRLNSRGRVLESDEEFEDVCSLRSRVDE